MPLHSAIVISRRLCMSYQINFGQFQLLFLGDGKYNTSIIVYFIKIIKLPPVKGCRQSNCPAAVYIKNFRYKNTGLALFAQDRSLICGLFSGIPDIKPLLKNIYLILSMNFSYKFLAMFKVSCAAWRRSCLRRYTAASFIFEGR